MVGYRSPNQNAYVERFVQAIERECLDKFIVFGREHLDHVCREYVEHNHTERPHQAMENPAAGGDGSSAPKHQSGGVSGTAWRGATA